MTGWQPRRGIPGPWHLTPTVKDALVSLCGVRVAWLDRYVKRDPLRIDDHKGERCDKCWQEWRLRAAASYAQQDQWEAGRDS